MSASTKSRSQRQPASPSTVTLEPEHAAAATTLREDSLTPLRGLLRDEDARRVDLARRLHHDVAGGLVACVAMSEMIRHGLEHDRSDSSVDPMLLKLDAALRETVRVVRQIEGEQLPPVLKSFGIGSAVEHLADHFSATSPAEVSAGITGQEPSIPLALRLSLHTVIDALIRRIVTEAGGTKLDIICLFTPSRVEFLMEHNGGDCMAAGQECAEVAALHARISLMGGRLLVSRLSSSGWRRLRLVLPLPGNSDTR